MVGPGDDSREEGLTEGDIDHDGDSNGPWTNTPAAPDRSHFPPGTALTGDRTPSLADRRDMLQTVAQSHGNQAADWLQKQLDGDANARATRELGGIVREGNQDLNQAIREGDNAITTAVREGDTSIVKAVTDGNQEITKAMAAQGRVFIIAQLVALGIVAAIAGVTSAMEFGGMSFNTSPTNIEARMGETPSEAVEARDDAADAAQDWSDVGPGLDTGYEGEGESEG